METMGDVLGDVLGDELDGELDGDLDGDIDGDDVVGARRRRRARRRMMALPAKASWRRGQMAPGIYAPQQGLELLTMTPNLNNGVFDTTNIGAVIQFTARPQRPYRAERLIAFVNRTPDAGGVVPAGFALANGIFVGTKLQQLTRGDFNIEIFGPTAFGVRMSLEQAEPGIDITIDIRLSIAPTTTQTVGVSMQFLGRSLM